MKNNADISSIKSEYNLKEIFAYLDYSHILKLLKNNKNLQNRLGLTLDNYKNKFETKKYEYIKKSILKTNKKYNAYQPPTETIWYFLFYLATICFFLIPFLIYSILLVSIKTFKDSNTKDNYNKKYLNIIKIINPCIFIYDILVVIFAYLFIGVIFIFCESVYGKRKIINFILTIIMNLVNFLFESLVIWKLILSYKIKKGGCTWFMVLDYLFLIFNLIYTIIILAITIDYIKESKCPRLFETNYLLTSFNNIKIDNYSLPEDFGKLSKKERKKYVFEHYKYYFHFISDEQNKLITSINDFRGIKNIPLLKECNLMTIPDFLINEISEVMLWPDKNIFKLSNKKYLFKYPIGKFEINFKNKDENILSILLKDNLNHIQIITHQNIEYIFIYELDFCDFCKYHINVSYSQYNSESRGRIYEDDIFNERLFESEYNNKIDFE